MKYHYLYLIVNRLNKKYYVGIHSTKNMLDGYFGSGKRLEATIKKYGRQHFSMVILGWYGSREELLQKEKEFVSEDLLKDPNCLNLKLGGEGGRVPGYKVSAETKAKLSSIHKGKILSEDHKQKLSKTRIGNANAKTRKVVVNGVEYQTIKDACDSTGINRTTIMNRLNSTSDKFKDTYYVES